MTVINNSKELIDKVRAYNFMGFKEYMESTITSPNSEDGYCYKCKKRLEPLTYINKEFFYQPCWDCCSSKRRDIKAQIDRIIDTIGEYYYNIVLGDRYLQLFIVDDIYYQNTLPHEYSIFKKIINSLEPPSRNDIWFLDWKPGYPKIISVDNMQGLKLVNLSQQYEVKNEENTIIVGNYKINFPEIIEADSKHYSRYNILNSTGERRSKRLKLDKDSFIKFYNTEFDAIKSIFKLTTLEGNDVAIRDLTYQDYVIIKLAIMRNKKFLKLIFEIILELAKSVSLIKDTVFLKNTVMINPSATTSISLLWNPLSPYKDKDSINISIF